MKYIDAAVIGGGILGCFTARNLRRWNISTVLIEQEADICRGITRANSGICYAGYDNKPGSLKAALTVRGNANMAKLCRELDVPFHRCGSLLVTYDKNAVPKLERKLENGIRNGVPGLKLLSGPEAEAMEPMLKKGVAAALFSPGTGTVNPWQLGIAAYENARKNGAEAMLNTKVLDVQAQKGGFLLQTGHGRIFCKTVFNCAGANADQIQGLAFAPSVGIHLDGAEYLVLDPKAEKPSRVIFHQAKSCGKGITAIPCVEGNLLISGVRKTQDRPFATTAEGQQELIAAAGDLLPTLDLSKIIRSFGAVRPNPYGKNGEDIHDYRIENPAPGFYSLIGIKTPGLTCANELGLYLARQGAAYLRAEENPAFDPCRQAIQRGEGPDFCDMICQCGHITRGQILEAIARGATTVDGIKRRVGTGMGPCQGSRCDWKIAKILKESGVNPDPLF